jgi:DNA-binding LytR/AlgR family response regulator
MAMDYSVAIVDDVLQDREYIAGLVYQWAQEKGHTVILKTFPSSEAFLFAREESKKTEMLLLDIEMGAMNGVELAKELRQVQKDTMLQLVFITGFPDFIAEGYEVDALHYLIKPVVPAKLFSVLDKAVTNLAKVEKHLRVTYDRRMDFIPLSKIYYIEAQRQYVLIHAEDGEYRMKTSLAETKGALDEYFFQCQRSFLVNLRYVAQVKNNCVILKNGIEVPIGRGMAEKVGKEIIKLF